MKRIFKKVPSFIIVALIIITTVAFTVLAANIDFDMNGDGKFDNSDIVAVMKSITGKELLPDESLADYDADKDVDVLDVIAIKRFMFTLDKFNDTWTIGIY